MFVSFSFFHLRCDDEQNNKHNNNKAKHMVFQFLAIWAVEKVGLLFRWRKHVGKQKHFFEETWPFLQWKFHIFRPLIFFVCGGMRYGSELPTILNIWFGHLVNCFDCVFTKTFFLHFFEFVLLLFTYLFLYHWILTIAVRNQSVASQGNETKKNTDSIEFLLPATIYFV